MCDKPNERLAGLAGEMANIFDGLKKAHGVYRITGTKGNKQIGEAVTIHEEVTTELWEKHLSGENGVGIVPILDDSTCRFGAIDVDKYADLNVTKVIAKIRKKKYPLVPCLSKSGGLHLYLFLKDFTPASQLRATLLSMAASLGFNGSEIFPKQSQVLVERGDIGSWINMPYFDFEKTTRHAVADDGSPLQIDDFISLVKKLRADLAELNKKRAISTGDFTDGPPCLQYLAENGVTEGGRNMALMNMAIYMKRAMPESWMDKLKDANQQYIKPPLPDSEVNTILSSALKKDYLYICGSPPLKGHCDRGACRTRKYGAGIEGEFPLLTGLTKYNTQPPIWFIEVDDGGRMELSTEELQNQIRFQRRCMECLNQMPPNIKLDQWRSIVQTLLDKLVVIDVPKDASSMGQLMEFLESFCTSRVQAKTKEELLIGKPWTEGGRHYFRMRDFLSYLERHRFREFKVNKIAQIMKEHGGMHDFLNLRGKGVNVWNVPEFEKRSEAELDLPTTLERREPM